MKRFGYKFGVVIIALIIFAELYLRVFYYEQLKTRTTDTNRIPDSLRVFNRLPNVEAEYITPGVNNKFRINNMGYVGPDFNVHKTQGIFRIVLIGNSNAVGKQMNGDNNFCTVLQKIFHENEMKVEIINYAREGGEKDLQNLYIIKNDIVKLYPDLVLFENDGQLTYKRYVYEGYRNYTLEYDPMKPETRVECVRIVDNIYKHKWLTCFYDLSFIIRAICKSYVDNHSDWDIQKIYSSKNEFEKYLYTYIKKDAKVYFPAYNVTWTYAAKELDKIESTLGSINCKFVMFTYASFSNELIVFLKEKGINNIQLKMSYYNLPINSKLEGHLNEIAHALIAERLFSLLILNSYIPQIN